MVAGPLIGLFASSVTGRAAKLPQELAAARKAEAEARKAAAAEAKRIAQEEKTARKAAAEARKAEAAARKAALAPPEPVWPFPDETAEVSAA